MKWLGMDFKSGGLDVVLELVLVHNDGGQQMEIALFIGQPGEHGEWCWS